MSFRVGSKSLSPVSRGSCFSITRLAELCHPHTKDGFFSCSPFNSAFLFDIKLLVVLLNYGLVIIIRFRH